MIDFIPIPASNSQIPNILKEVESSKRITYLITYNEPSEGFESYKKQLQEKFKSQIR